MKKKVNQKPGNPEEDKKFPLPVYKKEDDIYNREKEEQFKDEEQADKETENDLDIPGSELDDENEAIGEEDEENNYYSLGGDNHENLEENQE